MAALLVEQADSKHMYTFRTGHITFESVEEIPWTLDGEFGGSHDEVEINNLKQQLQIMVPKKHLKDVSGEYRKKNIEKNQKNTCIQ